jgi:hypothetical protein
VSYSASDQNRANHGIAIAGDATISALAQVEDRSAEKVAEQFTKDVNPQRATG